MNGLTRITDRIACDTERDAADLIARARQDAHEKHLHYLKAAEEKRAHLLALGHTQAQEQVLRTAAAAELDARKTILSVKQKLVSEVFEEALAQLMALPTEDYRALLIRLAVNASLTGHEDILLNETDHQHHGASLITGANQLLSSAGKPAALTLSSEIRTFSGGLILKAGPVETNCTLEVLLKLARNTVTGEVSKVLFDF